MRQAPYQIVCLNCKATFEVEEKSPYNFYGCSKCKTDSFVSNLSLELELEEFKKLQWKELISNRQGVWRYSALLPVSPQNQISLGEGNTPLLKLERIASELNLKELYLKNECQNPTWSHKDRLVAVSVSKALELGAQAVTVCTSGNQGAATAAYAAKAGLPCVVFTIEWVPQTIKILMQSYGAIVVALSSPEDRVPLMNKCIGAYGWYPTGNTTNPPYCVGSSYYGVEGCKTIAFEIFEQFSGEIPDVVVVPTGLGDIIYGIWKGFIELYQLGLSQTLPRMVAVEPFGPIANALSKGLTFPEKVPSRSTPSFSTACNSSTFQALKAVKDSGGTAIVIEDDRTIMRFQKKLAQLEGIYGEAASVTSLAALEQLLDKEFISNNDRVVCILTSTGLKDPASTAQYLEPILTLKEPDVDEMIRQVRESYRMELPRG